MHLRFGLTIWYDFGTAKKKKKKDRKKIIFWSCIPTKHKYSTVAHWPTLSPKQLESAVVQQEISLSVSYKVVMTIRTGSYDMLSNHIGNPVVPNI